MVKKNSNKNSGDEKFFKEIEARSDKLRRENAAATEQIRRERAEFESKRF